MLEVSPGVERLGFSTEELQTSGFERLVEPADLPLLDAASAGLQVSRGRFEIEYRLRTRAGERCKVRERTAAEVGADGALLERCVLVPAVEPPAEEIGRAHV